VARFAEPSTGPTGRGLKKTGAILRFCRHTDGRDFCRADRRDTAAGAFRLRGASVILEENPRSGRHCRAAIAQMFTFIGELLRPGSEAQSVKYCPYRRPVACGYSFWRDELPAARIPPCLADPRVCGTATIMGQRARRSDLARALFDSFACCWRATRAGSGDQRTTGCRSFGGHSGRRAAMAGIGDPGNGEHNTRDLFLTICDIHRTLSH